MRISDWSSDVCSSDLLSPANSPMPYSAKKCPAQTSSPPSRIAHVSISGHADRATEQRTGQALDGGAAAEVHRQGDPVAARLLHQPATLARSALRSAERSVGKGVARRWDSGGRLI